MSERSLMRSDEGVRWMDGWMDGWMTKQRRGCVDNRSSLAAHSFAHHTNTTNTTTARL